MGEQWSSQIRIQRFFNTACDTWHIYTQTAESEKLQNAAPEKKKKKDDKKKGNQGQAAKVSLLSSVL